MKIGIIGAENSHARHISKLINVEKAVRGFTVDCIWGETAKFAKLAAEEGAIPNIVKKVEDMVGQVDAIMVDHRHPKYHLDAARPFIAEGIPMFIDKPFCHRSTRGKAFLKAAKKAGAPVTSYSIMPMQKSYQDFLKGMKKLGRVTAGATYGPSDLKSKYGGVFFYGIHQVELALFAFGYDVEKVLVTQNGNGSTGQLLYKSGLIVTINLVKEGCYFNITAVGDKGASHLTVERDPVPYLSGVKRMCKFFKTRKEPISHADLLKPIQVLEAMEKSIKSKKLEKVAK